MSTNSARKEGEAAALEPPSLSVGFWDAFASEAMWSEPVLAVLSCTPIATDYYLLLATDGSLASHEKQEKRQLKRCQEKAGAQLDLHQRSNRDGKQREWHYQHGRILMRRRTLPCRPELLVNRLVTLLVYSKCRIKGRATPVVTDLQLLQGKWNQPNAQYITHPLYATGFSTNGSTSVKSTGKRCGDTTVDEASAVSCTKRPRDDREDTLCEKHVTVQAPVYSHSRPGPVAKVQRGVRMALADLHLYSHHWEVLARISYKSEVRSFANAKGESSLFVVHLIDSQATELRATFFGRAVSLWYPRLRVGGVYTFSIGTLQRANRVHNPLSHEVEIKFDATAQIEELEDDPSIPLQKFERVEIAHISNRPAGSILDILAFIVKAEEPQTIFSRVKNEELVRRELTLLDSSGAFISLALFGAQALQFPQSVLVNNPLVAIKGARVNDYAGRACLSSTAQMQMTWFPEQLVAANGAAPTVALISQSPGGTCGVSTDELEGERRWWQCAGKSLASAAVTKSPDTSGFHALTQIVSAANKLLLEEPGASISFRAAASVFDITGGQLVWLACPTCKRKVQKELPSASTSGAYKCNKCCRVVTPEPRWMLSLRFIDSSGTLSCVALGEQGQAIMRAVDVTAEGLSKLERGGIDTRGRAFADILEQLSFVEFELELTAKCEVYKGDKTVQIMVRGASLLGGEEWSHVARNSQLVESLLASHQISGPRSL